MMLLTKRFLAERAATCWRQRYFQGGTWVANQNDDAERIYQRLVALGLSPEPKAVNRVIGNGSWTELRCGLCDKSVDAVVVLGEPRRSSSHSVYACLGCLKKAAKLLE